MFLDKGYKLPPDAARHFTYMFELTTPFNKVVVQHKDSTLSLIGIRHKDGPELIPDANKTYDVVPRFKLTSINDVVATFEDMDPVVQQGYVVVDSAFNRIKIKHPGYVALHHMKAHFSIRYMIELVRKAELDEVITYFPEWGTLLNSINACYRELITTIDETYAVHKHLTNKKEFALAIEKISFKGVLFAIHNGHVKSAEEFLRAMHIDRLIQMLALPDVEVTNGDQRNKLLRAE